MDEQRPVEPSEILDRSGARVPAPAPARRGGLLPQVARAFLAGPALTASGLALAAAAGLKGAELVARAAMSGAVGPWPHQPHQPPGPPSEGVRISWTHVEIRWPS